MGAPTTVAYSDVLTTMQCGACGIPFAVPESWRAEKEPSGEGWHCPNGHPRVYRETTERRLERELQAERRHRSNVELRERTARDQLAASERSNAALRGHLTRWRKRVANGVCPVAGCKRHFPNVQRHVATEHPKWLSEHPEVFDT